MITRAKKVDDGYILEFKVPINSLPYPPGKNQIWNFNISRVFTLDGTFYRSQTQPYDRSDPCWVCQVTDKLIMKDIVYSGRLSYFHIFHQTYQAKDKQGITILLNMEKLKVKLVLVSTMIFLHPLQLRQQLTQTFLRLKLMKHK